MDARVDADADHHRGETDRDGAEPRREERRESGRPQRSEDERGQDRHEGARAPERRHERERRQDERQRAAHLEVPAHHLLGRPSDRVPARELDRHALDPRGGDGCLRAFHVLHQRLGVRRDERAPPRLGDDEARAAPVRAEGGARGRRHARRELGARLPRHLKEAQRVDARASARPKRRPPARGASRACHGGVPACPRGSRLAPAAPAPPVLRRPRRASGRSAGRASVRGRGR